MGKMSTEMCYYFDLLHKHSARTIVARILPHLQANEAQFHISSLSVAFCKQHVTRNITLRCLFGVTTYVKQKLDGNVLLCHSCRVTSDRNQASILEAFQN